MQTSPTVMQPSRDEIQREVENLRDIKRRSTLQGGPGTLIHDPDLPTPGAQAAAAQQGSWAPSDDSSSDSHSHEDSLGSDSASASDDPFHLFWVPANMHPEIDPAQFRAFLKEHAHAPGEVGLARSESLGSAAALGRKKSMLSRQYRPTENDGVEDEHIVPLRRNRSSLYGGSGPQLTIKDLEKLDELAEEASQSRDPSKLRSVLRRSLSMNMSPSVIDNLENAMPDPGEDADAPIIVPRPGQILRRAARTKIRKAGQTGEGAHRFNATRRGAGAAKRDTPLPVPDPRSSSDFSTSDHSDAESPRRLRLVSNESLDDARLVRPESYSAEAFIFDAYTHDETNDNQIKLLSPPSKLQSLPRRSLSPPPPLPSMEPLEPLPPVPSAQSVAALPPLEHPSPQRATSLVTPTAVEPSSRTPSPVQPDLVSLHTRPEPRPIQTAPSLSSTPPVPQGPEQRREKEKDKEKDKKGLFKWGGSEKKGKKEQREKEKDAGFFGSLFGSKKKQEESTAPAGIGHGQSGRDTAVALLGASKSSRGYVPSPSPQPTGGVNNYSRYPIHVERAIYRLSHIKLANPRRALYEQVLISNLMFWYLGVINKTQTQQQQQQQQQPASPRPVHAEQIPTELGGLSAAALMNDEDEDEDDEHTEEHEAESLLPAPQAQAQGPAVQQQQQPQNRRGSLTKAVPAGTAARRAEQPVRGPQYDMQHRAMEQEYGAAFSGSGGARQQQVLSGPPPGAGFAGAGGPVPMQMSMSMSMSVAGTGVKQAAFPSSSNTPDDHPPPPAASPSSRRERSPPPPSSSSTHPPSPRPPRTSSPPPIRYVPPPQQATPPGLPPAVARPPARSHSATVAPPTSARAPGRKAQSVHAVPPPGARRPQQRVGMADGGPVGRTGSVRGGGEEEDVPLALWQQQARRR